MRSILCMMTVVCGMLPGQLYLAQNQEVIAAKKALEAAYNSGNLAAIRSGTTKDHIAIAPHFESFTQADQLAELPKLKIESYEMHDLSTIQLSKEVVVLTFRAEIKGSFEGKKLTPHVRIVETWVNRGGRWLQATYQETPLAVR